MNKPIVSVIVPIYNTSPYLLECLDSIANQTYRNLEIILVDDGSTDTSFAIATEFAADKRVRLIRQKNQGVAGARNAGLDYATAEFITFVDSDDIIDSRLIEYLYDALISSRSDISAVIYRKTGIDSTLNTEDALRESLLEQRLNLSPCGKLFKSELFSGLRFPAGHKFEDVAIIPVVISRARFVTLCSQPYYHYRINPSSIVRSKQVDRRDFFRYSKELLNFITSKHPTITPYAEKYYFKAAFNIALDNYRSPHPNKSDITKALPILKTYAPTVLRLDTSKPLEKAVARLALINVRLARLCLFINAKIRRHYATTAWVDDNAPSLIK
jgi:glycosyltransferase involved in cell wall biosynthesis